MLRWLEEHRSGCDMRAEAIPWDRSQEWEFDVRALRHASGGFFSVVGVSARLGGRAEPAWDQPLIHQPEIGILGFLVRSNGAGPELLVQAKPEPGNIGLVQAAPSVQATESNYRRRHHGKATPHLDYFTGKAGARVLADCLQSEQGTRFLGKYNRNMIVQVPPQGPPEGGAAHRWASVPEVLELTGRDFCINTDARSVLVGGPWAALAPGGRPFHRWRGRGGLGEDLLRSYEAGEDACALPLAAILDRLEGWRASIDLVVEVVGLRDLAGWETTGAAIRREDGGGFEVRHYEVGTTEREVPHWDQPLVASETEGRCVLFAQERRGVLHFLFNARAEIGFREKCQYGPTLQDIGSDPLIPSGLREQADRLEALLALTEPLASGLHSDEGGRFFRCVARYGIHRLDPGVEIDPGSNLAWMTLGQTESLLRRPGIFSNEARSILSMLLAWL